MAVRGLKALKKIMQTTFDPASVVPADVSVTEFTGDDSLPRHDLAQHPIPADSLTWKYWGRLDVTYFGSSVMGPIAGAWPQMGQATSSSVLFTGTAHSARARKYTKRGLADLANTFTARCTTRRRMPRNTD